MTTPIKRATFVVTAKGASYIQESNLLSFEAAVTAAEKVVRAGGVARILKVVAEVEAEKSPFKVTPLA